MMNNMDFKIRIASCWTDIISLRDFWTEYSKHPEADFEFFTMILKNRGDSPLVLVAEDKAHSNPIAILVGRIENTKLPIRIGYSSVCNIPIRNLMFIRGGFIGFTSEVIWTSFCKYIYNSIRTLELDLITFEHIKIDTYHYRHLIATFWFFQRAKSIDPNIHWLLQLPSTFDEFMSQRSKKRRYWLNRLPRILDKDFPGTWAIKSYRTTNVALAFANAAEDIAKKTYHRGLGVGFYFNEEYLDRLKLEAARAHLRGYILTINNEPKAFWYCSANDNVLYLSATGYDPAFSNYELGTVLLLNIFREHCGSDIKCVDFGLGDADYKQRYGTEYFSESTVLIFPLTFRGVSVNFIYSLTLHINSFARMILNRLKLAHKVKTLWRKKAITADSNPENRD